MDTMQISSFRNTCIGSPALGSRLHQSSVTTVLRTVLLLLLIASGEVLAQGVGISESAITPDANAILELRSTLRGFLAPRMTTAQRTTLGSIPPSQGMLVYDTNLQKFYYWDSGTWNAIAAGTGVGTVTNFSAGTLSPLFTTSVATSTTTPALSFTLSSANAYTLFGNNSGASAAPSFFTPTLASALFQNQGTATTVLHGNAAGNPSWSAVALGSDITGTLALANGGTGATSKSAAFDALSPMNASGDMIYGGTSGTGTRLPKGTDGQVLTLASGLPSWQPVTLASSNLADPTATIGLSAINGTATTAMRSDAAPALSQSIIPTWSGLHTFTGGMTTTGTAALSLGADASAQTINIGTGGAAKSVTLGSSNTTSSTTIQSGSGGVLINSGVNQPTSINNGTSTGAVNIASGSSGGNVVTIGNTAGSTGITQRVGTGNYSLDGVAGSTYTIGASTTTGSMTIGGTAQTGTMTLGSSSGTNTLAIANGSGATTLNLANIQTGGSVNVGAGMTTGTITIGGTAQTGTMTLGSSSATNTLNVANGSGATTLNLANIQTGGAVNIGGGMTSGAISIGGTGAQTGAISIGTGTGAQTINLGTGGTGSKDINIGTGAAANAILIGNTTAGTTTGINVSSSTAQLQLGAGTATANQGAPLKLTSGTNLTSPEAGAVEYDGNVFYSTPFAGGRGISPSEQLLVNQAPVTLGGTTATACFTSASLPVNTGTYFFEGQIIITTSATSHTTALGFLLSGAATTVFEYTAELWSANANAISTTQSTTQVTGTASKVLNAASALVTTTIVFKGVANFSAGGTITPQIRMSANMATQTADPGSYCKFYLVGNTSVTSVGQ